MLALFLKSCKMVFMMFNFMKGNKVKTFPESSIHKELETLFYKQGKRTEVLEQYGLSDDIGQSHEEMIEECVSIEQGNFFK
jgi:hypothetical protein